MHTIGQILKEEREKKFYSLDEIEKVTKIRKGLLEALEQGQYTKLPPPTFVQGFIKNYGKLLGLNIDKLLAIYRREFAEGKYSPRVLETFSNPVDQRRFRLTPAGFLGSLILGLIVIFFVYLWFEYRFLVGSPFLEVNFPVDQYHSNSAVIEVVGRTDPEAKVSINNQEIGVDTSGKFSQEIQLLDDVNNIEIAASSKTGKVSKISRTVFFQK